MRETITEFAPAKVNLALHVTARRSDGYHEIDTICVFSEMGDRIEITASQEDMLELTGAYAQALACEPNNIVLKVRDLLRPAGPSNSQTAIAIALEKNLPIASGIGGGSADGAATLRALARLWKMPLPENAILAAQIGADIPICVASQPLRARGIGERLQLFDTFFDFAIVLANPGIAMSTPAIFGELENCSNPPLPPMAGRDRFADLLEWMRATRNDLQAPAISICPAIVDVLKALDRNGAAISRMSGSGATCFGLFPSLDKARIAAENLSNQQPDWFVAASGLHQHERRTHAAA